MDKEMLMDRNRLKNMLESLLLVSKKPLDVKRVEEILEVPAKMIEGVMEELVEDTKDKGIKVFRLAGGYQLGTNPENSYFVDKMVNLPEKVNLSASAIETLAIIAYKQPITKPEVDLIRGVDSVSVIDTLVRRRLVDEQGRSDQVGRPYLYGTTEEFLMHFGLKDVVDLPALPENLVSQMSMVEGVDEPLVTDDKADIPDIPVIESDPTQVVEQPNA